MIPKWCIALRSLTSIGVGGASGAVLPLVQQVLADGKFDHLDGHHIAQTAFYGAFLALLFHFRTPPNQQPQK